MTELKEIIPSDRKNSVIIHIDMEKNNNLLCDVKSPGPYRDGDNSIGGLI